MAMFDQTFVDGVGKTHKSWTVIAVIRGAVRDCSGLDSDSADLYRRAAEGAVDQLADGASAASASAAASAPRAGSEDLKVAPRQFDAGRLMAPHEIPKNVAIIVEERSPPCRCASRWRSASPAVFRADWVECGRHLGVAPPPPPPPPVKAVPSRKPGRMRVGGNVQAANLIKKVTPGISAAGQAGAYSRDGAVHGHYRQGWHHSESSVGQRPSAAGCGRDRSGEAMDLQADSS